MQGRRRFYKESAIRQRARRSTGWVNWDNAIRSVLVLNGTLISSTFQVKLDPTIEV